MTLDQLRIFVAVAEREHVTQAARDLNLTQSATSAAVSALESRYATRLFDRVGRRILLTDAGRLFLGEAKAVLARAANAELVLADLAGLRVGSLRIAASQTVGNYWLPKFIHRFRSLYPGLDVSLTIGNTETVAALVRRGEANLGFVEGPVVEISLEVNPVAQDVLVLVAPAGHPWSTAVSEQIDLRSSPWVMRETGSGTRSVAEEMLRKKGHAMAEIDIRLMLPTNESVKMAVEAGAGVTVLSSLVAADSISAGKIVAVDYAVPTRLFSMLRHRDHHVTAAEQQFASLLEGAGMQLPAPDPSPR